MKIKSIERLNEEKDIYCVEVDNPHHELVLKCNSGNNYRCGNCNFGLIYGMHWSTFQVHGEVNGFELTDQEAQDYVNSFFDTYKGLKAVVENSKNLFMYGTELEIPRWIKYKNDTLHQVTRTVGFFTQCKTLLGRRLAVDTDRKLMNYPVQGSGADAIKLGICRMGYITRQKQSTYRSINLVHDDTIGKSKLYDFDFNSEIFRESLEFAINYILRYHFRTPVNQDFCILSMFGEEVFLEEALTLQDVDAKIIEKMKEYFEKLKKSTDTEEQVELTKELNKYNRVLTKLRDRVKQIDEAKQPDNSNAIADKETIIA